MIRLTQWILSGAFLAFVFAGSAQAQQTDLLEEIVKRGEIRVGTVLSAPYVMKNPKSGELEGAVVDMGARLAKGLNVKLTWVETGFDTMIAGLQAGQYDIVMTISGRGLSRAQSVWFTKPWIIGAQSFLVRKDDHLRTREDLDKEGNVIVVTLGSQAHTLYTKTDPNFFKHATVKALTAPALPAQEVASGRAVAFGDGMTETGQIAKEFPEWAQSIILPETRKATGAGFIVPQGQANLLHYMDLFIDDMIQSEYVLGLADKWGMVKDAIVTGYPTYGSQR